MLKYVVASAIGPILVELVGYWWHRSVEHDGVFGKLTRKFQLAHYSHHEELYTADSLRSDHYKDSDGSWGWYLIGAVVTALIISIFGWKIGLATSVSGWVYGLLVIQYFHHSFHVESRFLNKFEWFRRLASMHDTHHHKRVNYGIVFFWMDRLFGTYQGTPSTDKEPLFRNLETQ